MMNQQPHTLPSNKEAVIELLTGSILEMFPNMHKDQVEMFCYQFFNNVEDHENFEGSVSDMMISTKSFAQQGNDFYEHKKKVSIFIKVFILNDY